MAEKFIVEKVQKKVTLSVDNYKKLKGLSFKPKSSLKLNDMVNINKMIVINPVLVNNLVHRKCNIGIDKLLVLLSALYEDDGSDGDDNAALVLNEEEKFRNTLINKYKAYLKEEDLKEYLKKLEIIKTEILLRQKMLYEEFDEKKGKGGR